MITEAHGGDTSRLDPFLTADCVRFAFWGAEESGLLGSEHYVSQLTKRQIGKFR